MIKVIFVDTARGGHDTVQEYREQLKNDGMARMRFACNVNGALKVFLNKLREEKKEEEKCLKKSKQ